MAVALNDAMKAWMLRTKVMAASQMKLKLLSSQDSKTCNDYLDKHFNALLNPGAAGTKADDYSPALDGKPAQLSDVVNALLPQTLFGSYSNPLLAPSREETASELLDLVNARYDSIVSNKTSQAASDSGAPPGNQSGSVQLTIPVRMVTLLWEEFLAGINNASVSAQWNAWRSTGGPVPPTMQYNFNLTMPALIKPGDSDKDLKVTWLDAWQAGVTFNSSGPRVSDQETLTIIKLHLDIKKLHGELEASLAGVGQGLLFGGPAQGGGQAQVQGAVKVRGDKKIFINFGGQGMANKEGFNLTLYGSAGVNF